MAMEMFDCVVFANFILTVVISVMVYGDGQTKE